MVGSREAGWQAASTHHPGGAHDLMVRACWLAGLLASWPLTCIIVTLSLVCLDPRPIPHARRPVLPPQPGVGSTPNTAAGLCYQRYLLQGQQGVWVGGRGGEGRGL